MFKFSDHLGFFNPYFIKKDGLIHTEDKFNEIIKAHKSPKEIDVLAISEILNTNYIFADRTIIQGIHKSPWMANLNAEATAWNYHDVPNHKEIDVDENEIAEELFQRLLAEILSYTEGKNKIGILLSGGMDSRIVAGLLDYLLQNGKLSKQVEISALTWGNSNSRDVIYARKIAELLNWEWKHYVVSAEDLRNNIDEVAKNGCEFSPLHLHALPQMRVDNQLDCVLAGSYGDSVGRAEYSSVKVRNLKSVAHNFRNVGSLLRQTAFNETKRNHLSDLDKYHQLFPQKLKYQQYEQDYQLHYMRRMLNPCMKFIGNHNPLFQAFTAPDVFGYMWSLKPELRNDSIYSRILKKINPDLAQIPWARTGLPYGVSEGVPDSFMKAHHSYKKLITEDLYEEIKSLVLSEEIKSLEIFNTESLINSLKLIKTVNHTKHWYEEKLIWIASLAKAVSTYNIKSSTNYNSTAVDTFSSKFLVPLEFYGRNRSISNLLKKI
jgi:asparagine synthase (glutamine-hydrolysing)